MSDNGVWRFLSTGLGDAFFNMGMDEAIAESVQAGVSPPTFRVYGWAPPAISFGYAQRIDREVDLESCRRLGIDLVRRPTGGRAVLHWQELTYSVVCRWDDPTVGGSLGSAYRAIGEGLAEGLRRLGVEAAVERKGHVPVRPRGSGMTPPCFSSAARSEIMVSGRKLVGSAQRQMGDILLQHGSVLIGAAHLQIVETMSLAPKVRARTKESLRSSTICLEELVEDITFEKLAESLRIGMEERLKVRMETERAYTEEYATAERLKAEKYGTAQWTFPGRTDDGPSERDRAERQDTG